MESKMLSIRSFEKNQALLSLINKLITHLKLKSHGIEDKIDMTEIDKAKQILKNFLLSVEKAIGQVSPGSKILKGADLRERSFIRKYIEAGKKPKQYGSVLFKKSPSEVIARLEDNRDNNDVIEALTDLRNLINEHIAVDLKDLVGDI
jgi:hypothetical protein